MAEAAQAPDGLELRYPPELPVSERRAEILAALDASQVVVVAGETGSGKSTQLPKICLELGRGREGMIGHTQPRRLAARAVAERVAEELGTELGDLVGYTVRFTDRVGERTRVKVMTDGILLAELQRDRMLRRYDTLIVDEAHERSLNIDFILGYLKQLLPRRPDLKVVITSATIDTARFSQHFDDAPVVEVSGRTYPVEVRYRPLVDAADDVDRDQVQAIVDAVSELGAEGPGDILVFLSGEREIRDTADALRRMDLHDTELLPLYARLSAAEQHRVFQPHQGRRVVLATNVAETSLTVPGIRYVVDPGTARISRYSRRTKVQRLPIESISQASANQRAGRCGRVAPGVCIRLYAEDDFESRPAFTEPEIVRTNLASVILQMAAIGLGDVAAFPFVDPPDARSIKDGVALLEELGALDPAGRGDRARLTPLGRRLAQLPLDPRLGRMVLEADRNGCVREVMVIAAALSIQDPRERPADKRGEASEKHGRFAEDGSDLLSYLKLWDHVRDRQKALSSNQFRRLCRAEMLNHLRVREWQDVYSQLLHVARRLGIKVSTDAGDRNRVHMSILAGLLSHVGMRDGDKREYRGARNARFAIAPGSVLFEKPPRWVMAAELVETNRLWARGVARIQPEWVERVGGHLLQRTYSEPHWDRDRGEVRAYERATLYGLPIVASRRVGYARVDPAAARELFIQHALVEGDWQTHHAFFHANRKLVDELRALEARARRRDILVGDDVLFDLYDDRLPADVVSARHFDAWWKKARTTEPDLLTFSADMLVSPDAGEVSVTAYPDTWRQGDLELPLTYGFEPGSDADGVTVDIPLAVLNRVTAEGFDWQVPGLREELVTSLLRSLPKPVRRSFVPVREHARAFLERATPADGPLLATLERELGRLTGVGIPGGSWDLDRVPSHLRITFRVIDESGTAIAVGKDLEALQARLGRRIRSAVASAAPSLERDGLTAWTIGALPRTVDVARGGHTVRGYPALVDEGGTVGVRVLATAAEQAEAMWAGTRRLLLLRMPSARKAVRRLVGNDVELALAGGRLGSTSDLLDDCIAAAVDRLVANHGGPAWDEVGFEALRAAVADDLVDTAAEVVTVAGRVVIAAARVEQRLRATTAPATRAAVDDMHDQLDRLVHPGFVTAAGARRLPDLARYLEAIDRRLDKVITDPGRDLRLQRQVQHLEAELEQVLAALPPGRPPEAVQELRWSIEELRVSLFAQSLGTRGRVSEQRILKEMDRIAPRV